jgi:hypothetical protein
VCQIKTILTLKLALNRALSYRKVMTHREILQPPAESLEFAPTQWDGGLSLTPGTVLRFTHALTDKVIFFQCIESVGHKEMGGVFTETATGVASAPAEAVLKTSSPNPYMAQSNSEYIEVVVTDDDKQTSIMPAYDLIETAFDEELLLAATQQPQD